MKQASMKKFGKVFLVIITLLSAAVITVGVMSMWKDNLIIVFDWIVAIMNFVTIIFLISVNEFLKSSDKGMKWLRVILWIFLLANMGGLANFIVDHF